jgi:hypothetical protein
MALIVNQATADALGFSLPAAVLAHKAAVEAHRLTVGVPAPTAHPIVEAIVRQHGGLFSVVESEAPVEEGPLRVTRAQARIALSRAGLLSAVEAAVSAADEETRIWYADAGVWKRNAAPVVSLGASLNLTPAQIDALFITASQIDV